MALTAGSITVDHDDGTHTGTGAALTAFDAWWAAVSGDTQWPVGTPALVEIRVQVKEGMGKLIAALCSGLLTEITSNAVVTVTIPSGTGGLQKIPNPVVAGADADGPAADKYLGGTVA